MNRKAAPVVEIKEIGQKGESPLDVLSDMENMAENLTAGRYEKIASRIARIEVKEEKRNT